MSGRRHLQERCLHEPWVTHRVESTFVALTNSTWVGSVNPRREGILSVGIVLWQPPGGMCDR